MNNEPTRSSKKIMSVALAIFFIVISFICYSQISADGWVIEVIAGLIASSFAFLLLLPTEKD